MSNHPNRISKRIMKKKNKSLSLLPGFLLKLYEMVSNPENSDAIEFNARGDAFIVKNERILADHLLPRLFKHNNFSSFVRQLNMYGFKKIRNVDNQNEFRHKYFQRSQKNQLAKIFRKNGPKYKLSPDSEDNKPDIQDTEQKYQNLKNEITEVKRCNQLIEEVNQSFSQSTLVFIYVQQQLKQEVEEMKQRSDQWDVLSTAISQIMIQKIKQQNCLPSNSNFDEMSTQNYQKDNKTSNNYTNNSNSDTIK